MAAYENHISNQEFYDRISKVYDALADASEHEVRAQGEAALGLSEGDQILELGFGTGSAVLELAPLVGSSGKISGVDISPGMLAVANEKLEKQPVDTQVELQVADACSLPYEDSCFDAVFTSMTLELFPENEIPIVLSEALRVLKPGGKIGVVNMASIKGEEHESLMEKAYKWFHRHFPHIVDCRPIDSASYVEAAGFQIQQETRIEIWKMPVAILVAIKP